MDMRRFESAIRGCLFPDDFANKLLRPNWPGFRQHLKWKADSDTVVVTGLLTCSQMQAISLPASRAVVQTQNSEPLRSGRNVPRRRNLVSTWLLGRGLQRGLSNL